MRGEALSNAPPAVTVRYRLSKSYVRRASLEYLLRRKWYMGFVPLIGLVSVAVAIMDWDRLATLAFSGALGLVFGALFFLLLHSWRRAPR